MAINQANKYLKISITILLIDGFNIKTSFTDPNKYKSTNENDNDCSLSGYNQYKNGAFK